MKYLIKYPYQFVLFNNIMAYIKGDTIHEYQYRDKKRHTLIYDLLFIYCTFQHTIKQIVKDDLRTRSIIKNSLLPHVYFIFILFICSLCKLSTQSHWSWNFSSVLWNCRITVVLNQYGRRESRGKRCPRKSTRHRTLKTLALWLQFWFGVFSTLLAEMLFRFNVKKYSRSTSKLVGFQLQLLAKISLILSADDAERIVGVLLNLTTTVRDYNVRIIGDVLISSSRNSVGWLVSVCG
jgi:hypothetical protein